MNHESRADTNMQQEIRVGMLFVVDQEAAELEKRRVDMIYGLRPGGGGQGPRREDAFGSIEVIDTPGGKVLARWGGGSNLDYVKEVLGDWDLAEALKAVDGRPAYYGDRNDNLRNGVDQWFKGYLERNWGEGRVIQVD